MIQHAIRPAESAPLSVRNLTISIIGIDVLLIVCFVVTKALDILYGIAAPDWAVLGGFSNLGSIWNYGKYLFVVALCVALGSQFRRAELFCMGAMFAMLLYDDYFEFHEYMGRLLSDRMTGRELLGLRTQDIGELVGVALLFALSVLLFFLAFRWTDDRRKVFLKKLLFLVLALGFCGVGLDMLHVVFKDIFSGVVGSIVNGLFSIGEEGGELVVSSLLVGVVVDESFPSESSAA